jgi:hypothetical protein
VKREIAAKQDEQRKVQEEMALYQSRSTRADSRSGAHRADARLRNDPAIYRGLLAKREDSKMAANLEQRQVGEQFRVLDPARVPERPSARIGRDRMLGVAVGLPHRTRGRPGRSSTSTNAEDRGRRAAAARAAGDRHRFPVTIMRKPAGSWWTRSPGACR